MKLKTEIKKGKDLSKEEFDFMNNQRIREYGNKTNLFNRTYHNKTNFFFVKHGKVVVTFGFLRPVEITYKNKKYNIFALGGIMAIEKKKGYGIFLINAMIDYSRKTGKTILGFTGKETAGFYKKAGLKVKQDFSLRLEMENPKTKERIPDVDGACPGIYYGGKDKFTTKVVRTKGIATYWMPDIKEPHF